MMRTNSTHYSASYPEEKRPRNRAFTKSATLPPNLNPPKVPRNLVTSFAYFPLSMPLVAARRFKGKSYHGGWSFRSELMTGWLKFTLGSGDISMWRRLMDMSELSGKARARDIVSKKLSFPKSETNPVDWEGHWVKLQYPSRFKDSIDAKDHVLLYFHGGGYVTGKPMMYAVVYQQLLKMMEKKYGITGFKVFAVRYPLAPENQYPAQSNAAFEAFKYLTQECGILSERIYVGGDSAGGNLTMNLLQNIRIHGMAMPAGAILISPWVEMVHEVPDYATKVDTRKDYLSPRCSKPFIDAFLGTPPAAELTDPLVAPTFADLTGMPPMLVFWGGVELLRESIVNFIEKLHAADVEVTTYVDVDMPHIYPLLGDFYPKNADKAQAVMGKWLAEHIQANHVQDK